MGLLRRIGATFKRAVDRRPNLVFCGDSHIGVPKRAYKDGLFGGRRAKFVQVGGATAIGLRHPTSKTQALVKFRAALLPWRSDIVPVFQIGEVDCGFVIWHRAAKYDEPVDAQLEASLDAYGAFLKELVDAGYGNLIVTSAVLPTIRDEATAAGEVAHLRSGIGADQRQRTELTLRHNARLEEIARRLNVTYVDLSGELLDRRTGLIDEKFLNPDPSDHHLHPERGGALWVDKLMAVI